MPACRHFGVGVVPYFPLASGLLTGKYRRGEPFPEGSRLDRVPRFANMATAQTFDRVERLSDVAEASGHTILELAIGWLLSQAGVSSVLTGATHPSRSPPTSPPRPGA
ncbi:MAG: aldo/keto reductase [Acidimicrobiales bacterium]